MNRETRWRSNAHQVARRPGGGFHRRLERLALAFKAKHGRFPDYHRLTAGELGVLQVDLEADLGAQAEDVLAFMEYQGLALVLEGSADDAARKAAGQYAGWDIDLVGIPVKTSGPGHG